MIDNRKPFGLKTKWPFVFIDNYSCH